MAFKKGESGNPTGRPKGRPDKRTELRKLLEPHAEQLIKKAVELALSGDVSAIRLCMDKLIANLRPTDDPIALPALKDAKDLAAKGNAVLDAVAAGTLTPDQAASLQSMLSAQVRIVESTELAARVAALEEPR